MHGRHSNDLAALEHQRAESEALFASIGDGAIVTDEQGKISRINEVALDLLGFTEKDLVGEWFPGIIRAFDEDGEPIEAMDRPIVRAFLEGRPITETLYYATKDGRRLAAGVTVSPVFLDDKPIGAIEVFRDVTVEHEIDRMKSEFISIASHQLRTPLTAIQTYAHLLASGFKGSLTKDQHEFMDIILGSVDRMNDIITTLLDVSRIEAGKLSIEFSKTDVCKLASTIIQELNQAAHDKKVKLSSTLPEKPLHAVTDPLLLAESYANLISNAIKYTPPLGSVKVSLEHVEDSILFTVKDTGLGIPHKMQNQIFTKFFRAPNVMKHDTTGTGLGLYMVKQIADTLDGKTWFTSREGRGSTFYFQIPINSNQNTTKTQRDISHSYRPQHV